jgi:alpha-amylase
MASVPTAEQLRDNAFGEQGDFYNSPYEFDVAERSFGGWQLRMRRNGLLNNGRSIFVEKTISLADSTADIQVDYLVRALDGRPLEGYFGLEMTCKLSAGSEPDRYYMFDGKRPAGTRSRLTAMGEHTGSSWSLNDQWLDIRLEVNCEHPANIVHAPIETVSLSEEGFERNYQGSMVMALWELKPAQQWTTSLRQTIQNLSDHR